MKSEIKLRRIKIGLKLLTPAKKNTIAQDVLLHALTHGTEWTDEVNEDIGDMYGSGHWLKSLAESKYLHAEQDWWARDRLNQWERLEKKVLKTTGLYKELNPSGEMQGPAPYITHNPRESESIR